MEGVTTRPYDDEKGLPLVVQPEAGPADVPTLATVLRRAGYTVRRLKAGDTIASKKREPAAVK